jgi:LysR family transcriptional activator of nhaA
MDTLNYNHLLYFWTVAREGSVTRAAELLQLAQPTISSQVRKLESSVGQQLFERKGRHLRLTETGQLVFRYADEMFALGGELVDVLGGRPADRPLRFSVGTADVLPKLITYRILQPVMVLPEGVQLVCQDGKLDDLLAEMAVHRLDVVLSDSPVSPSSGVRAFNHPLGECAVSVFAVASLARRYRQRFPHSLDAAPWLLPTRNTVLRRSLDQYFDAQDLRPQIIAEFEDSALMKTFAQAGHGLFASPAAIEEEICAQYHVAVVGRLDTVTERFYAISPEKRVKHPAVVAITQEARHELFGQPPQ